MINSSSIDTQTDHQSADNNTANAARPPTTLAPDQGTTASLDQLLSAPSPAPLAPVTAPVSSSQAAAMLDARTLSPLAKRKLRRNGRVACLPKHARDMVNRMLWNGIAYKNIVEAVSELGFTLSERNVSNWATGGYLEWRLEQEAVLQARIDQDHLVDFLRRDDAPELSEVGLQAAATRLSQVLLQKLAKVEDPETDLKTYSEMVNILCRLNREISTTQKERNDSRRCLGPEYEPARVKEEEEVSAIHHERCYSDPPSDSDLPKPSVPPMLPPIPTASFNAQRNREAREDAELERMKERVESQKRILAMLEANNSSDHASPIPAACVPAPASAASKSAQKPAPAATQPQSAEGAR